MVSKDKWSSQEKIIFILIIAIFCIYRLDSIRFIWSFPEIRLLGPDSYYHLRRIIFTYENFPQILLFDSFLSYPEGDYVPWTFLFDFLFGLIGKVFNDPIVPAVFSSFAFSLLFLLIIILYQNKNGKIALLTTVSVLSVSHWLGKVQSAGYIDHHSLETLLVTAYYLILLSNIRDRYKFIILPSIVSVSFLNWPGAPLYYFPSLTYVIYKIFFKKGNDYETLLLGISFFISGIFLWLYLSFSEHNVFPYSFKYLSGFQRDFCFFVSFVMLIVYFYSSQRINLVMSSIIVTIITLVFFRSLFIEVLSGFFYLSKSSQSNLMSMVSESSPLFGGKGRFFFDDVMRNIYFFTPFYLLTPLVIYYHFRKKKIDLLFFAFAYFFILTTFQVRMGTFFMPFLAMYIGNISQNFYKRYFQSFFKRYLFLLFSLIWMVGFFIYTLMLGYWKFDFEKDELYETMHYLREKTPLNELFLRGETPYGVLSGWGIGHYVITLGNRPALSHNFIAIAKNNKELLYIKTLLSKNEEEVVTILDEYNAPYLVLSNFEDNIILGWDILYPQQENPYYLKGNEQYVETERINELIMHKIRIGYPTKNLRLIFETFNFGNLWHYYGILERVIGANLYTKMKGKIIVILNTKNGKKEIEYYPEVNEDGKYRFVIPYSSNSHYQVKAESIYFLSENGIKREINIDEMWVLRGSVINID